MTTKHLKLALEVARQRPFSRIDGSVRRFRKDVLHVGHWVHPATGQDLDFSTPAELAAAAAWTNKWIDAGNEVFFPNGHSYDAKKNMGRCVDFSVEGAGEDARLACIVECADEEAAGQLGRTITAVSPCIEWNMLSSSGEVYPIVITHVAATPDPVIPAQGNFVELARELDLQSVLAKAFASGVQHGAHAPKGSSMADKNAPPPPAPHHAPPAPPSAPPPPPAASPDSELLSAVRAALGLSPDADSATAIAALQQQCPAGAEPMPAMMSRLSREHRDLQGENTAIRAELARVRTDRTHEIVEAARAAGADVGVLMPEDDRKTIVEYIASGDVRLEKAGRSLLDRHNADVKRAREGYGRGTPRENPDGEKQKKAELERHQVRAKQLRSQGWAVEVGPDGKILKETPPARPERSNRAR